MSGIAEGQLTSLALCWRIERADGAGLALTSHDRPVARDGITYRPAPGMTPAAVARRLGIEPSDGEAKGAVTSDALSEGDMADGRWNGARVALSAIDWAASEAEPVRLLGGRLGTVALRGDEFTADLSGATARLDEPVCPATSAECRAQLGDRKCRVDLAGRTMVATVTAAVGGQLTLDQVAGADFVLGRLVYLSGRNCGLQTVIIGAADNVVDVRDLPRGTVEAGTKVELRHGCDKRFETCAARFANAVNFRGEPHLPGNDLLTRYPGA
jgi:uncharacterized phage protein (TIGR02218 family)